MLLNDVYVNGGYEPQCVLKPIVNFELNVITNLNHPFSSREGMSWSHKMADGACCVVWEFLLSSEIAVEKKNLGALSLLYYKQVID